MYTILLNNGCVQYDCTYGSPAITDADQQYVETLPRQVWKSNLSLPKKILTEALHEFIVIPIPTNHILLPLVLKYGVLPLAGWQVAAKAALSLSFLSRTHDRKYNERLVD